MATMLLLPALVLFGCAPGKKAYAPSGQVECGSAVSWEVTKDAEITEFKCFVDEYRNKFESVQYTIGIRNVSDRPRRYRVNIFISEGRAVGGLLPETGKSPVVEPGETVRATYPMKDFKTIPEKIEVVVRTISEK